MGVLSQQQVLLVNQNLDVVDKVLHSCIEIRNDIPGMEYEDLVQVGSLALCKAAQRYDGRCQFSTFAWVVVKNALLDHCRRILSHSAPAESLDAELSEDNDGNLLERIGHNENPCRRMEDAQTRQLLAQARRRYKGVTRKGIDAISMQVQEYSSKEIAALYGVRSNMVAAWVSRARNILKKDREFMRALEMQQEY